MTRIFDNVGPQLGLGSTSRRRMCYIMGQVLGFLDDSKRHYKRQRKDADAMQNAETEEERKKRKGLEKRSREKELHHNSVLSRVKPLAGAIIYAVCREEGKPVTLGTVAVRFPRNCCRPRRSAELTHCHITVAFSMQMAVGEGPYAVGKSFTQMKRHLNIGNHEVDPILFIEPAVSKLKLSTPVYSPSAS